MKYSDPDIDDYPELKNLTREQSRGVQKYVLAKITHYMEAIVTEMVEKGVIEFTKKK